MGEKIGIAGVLGIVFSLLLLKLIPVLTPQGQMLIIVLAFGLAGLVVKLFTWMKRRTSK